MWEKRRRFISVAWEKRAMEIDAAGREIASVRLKDLPLQELSGGTARTNDASEGMRRCISEAREKHPMEVSATGDTE